MILILVGTILVSIICVLFGTVLGVKMAELFNWVPAAAIGPLAAFAVGLGFGVTRLPLAAGLIAAVIGAVGSTIAMFRWRV